MEIRPVSEPKPSGKSSPTDESSVEPLVPRVHRALGPLAVGIILDLLDLATFGVVGIYLGAIIGMAAGWYLGTMAGLSPRARFLFGCAAAVYLTIPLTEFLPVATIVSAAGRFLPRRALSGRSR